MSTKVSIPWWVACVAFGVCIGFLYFAGTLLLSHINFHPHHFGEGRLDVLELVMRTFPFGRWIYDNSLSYLLNGLLWGALGSGFCAMRLWRKNTS